MVFPIPVCITFETRQRCTYHIKYTQRPQLIPEIPPEKKTKMISFSRFHHFAEE
jgi:hypothetical protein